MADHATQRTTIGVRPQELFDVVTDFERYGDWARDLKSVEVLSRDSEGRGVEVQFRAAAMGRSTTYVLEYDYSEAPRVLSWKLQRGDLTRRLDGSYEFNATPGRDNATDVVYRLQVELIIPLPGFVKSRAEGIIMRNALRELKAHVEPAR